MQVWFSYSLIIQAEPEPVEPSTNYEDEDFTLGTQAKHDGVYRQERMSLNEWERDETMGYLS